MACPYWSTGWGVAQSGRLPRFINNKCLSADALIHNQNELSFGIKLHNPQSQRFVPVAVIAKCGTGSVELFLILTCCYFVLRMFFCFVFYVQIRKGKHLVVDEALCIHFLNMYSLYKRTNIFGVWHGMFAFPCVLVYFPLRSDETWKVKPSRDFNKLLI